MVLILVSFGGSPVFPVPIEPGDRTGRVDLATDEVVGLQRGGALEWGSGEPNGHMCLWFIGIRDSRTLLLCQ